MSRIRTIKPEFFTSADICDLNPLTRLLYISLWCEADREGRLIWNEKTLKLRYFPANDNDEFNFSIGQLSESGLIDIYEIEGKKYCEIPSFKTHQVINNREAESKLPKKPHGNDASFTRESGVQAEGKGKEGKGKEGKGRERKGKEGEKDPDFRYSRKVILPKNFHLTDEMRLFYQKKGYTLPIKETTDQWLNYIRRENRKFADWYAAWQNGMQKAHEFDLQRNPKVVNHPKKMSAGENARRLLEGAGS